MIGAPGYERNKGLLASLPTIADSTADFTIGDHEARDANGNRIDSTDPRSLDQYQGTEMDQCWLFVHSSCRFQTYAHHF